LKDNPEIIESFTKVTGYSAAQFNAIVKFGAGPWITPTRTQERTLDQSAPYQEQSQYDPDNYPENLFLNGSSLDALESSLCRAPLGSKELSSNMFVVSIMIMHEAAHYAHYKTHGKGTAYHFDIKYGGTDKGYDFFKLAFGTDFTSKSFIDNAFDAGKARSYANSNEGITKLFGLAHAGLLGTQLFQPHWKQPKLDRGDPTMPPKTRPVVPPCRYWKSSANN
jgi:hypothetical protein